MRVTSYEKVPSDPAARGEVLITLRFQGMLQSFQVDAVFSERREYSIKYGFTFHNIYWMAPEPITKQLT
jgi:hypothetical protein